MRFKDLSIGQTFDWINPDHRNNTFFRPCIKISPRKYRTVGGGPIEEFQVGSVNAPVFHVGEFEA